MRMILFLLISVHSLVGLGSIALAETCGRVMMLPDGGAGPLCASVDCTQKSDLHIVRTGEILEACQTRENLWEITDSKFDDAKGDLFIFGNNLAPEINENGRLCFAMDLEAGVEAKFFDESLRISGNGEHYGESIELNAEVRGEVAATASVGGSVQVCPRLKRPRVVKPSQRSMSRPDGLPQRMVVSSIQSINGVERDRNKFGFEISGKAEGKIEVSMTLEAYCLDQDERTPDDEDRFYFAADGSTLLLNDSVLKFLAVAGLEPRDTVHCVWLARSEETYADKLGEQFEILVSLSELMKADNGNSVDYRALVGEVKASLSEMRQLIGQCGRILGAPEKYRQSIDIIQKFEDRL